MSTYRCIEEEEAEVRKDLSVAHWLTRHYGMDELQWNHISVKLSDGASIITPGDRMFDDIMPHHLHKSSNNVTAEIIHAAVYNGRPDVKCIVHLHTPATVAVSCLKQGFRCLAQESGSFHKKVAYHDWEGLSDDLEEGPRIEKAVKGGGDGAVPPNVLLMRNHGFCTFGKTVAEAWVTAYYFNRSCMTQMSVLQTGAEAIYPQDDLLAHVEKQTRIPEFAAGVEWAALKHLAARHGHVV